MRYFISNNELDNTQHSWDGFYSQSFKEKLETIFNVKFLDGLKSYYNSHYGKVFYDFNLNRIVYISSIGQYEDEKCELIKYEEIIFGINQDIEDGILDNFFQNHNFLKKPNTSLTKLILFTSEISTDELIKFLQKKRYNSIDRNFELWREIPLSSTSLIIEKIENDKYIDEENLEIKEIDFFNDESINIDTQFNYYSFIEFLKSNFNCQIFKSSKTIVENQKLEIYYDRVENGIEEENENYENSLFHKRLFLTTKLYDYDYSIITFSLKFCNGEINVIVSISFNDFIYNKLKLKYNRSYSYNFYEFTDLRKVQEFIISKETNYENYSVLLDETIKIIVEHKKKIEEYVLIREIELTQKRENEKNDENSSLPF